MHRELGIIQKTLVAAVRSLPIWRNKNKRTTLYRKSKT